MSGPVIRPACGDAGRVARGFSLLEVMVALAILAMGISVLLSAQASSIANAARARDVTIATLLARSKMIDIEKTLFDEGFTAGESDEEGDFNEEGFPQIKWKYKVSEVELELGSLSGLCEGFGSEGGDGGACSQLTGAMGASFETLTESLGRSLRLVDLSVSWPQGRSAETVTVRSIVTREDYNLMPTGGPGPAGAPVPGQQGTGTGPRGVLRP